MSLSFMLALGIGLALCWSRRYRSLSSSDCRTNKRVEHFRRKHSKRRTYFGQCLHRSLQRHLLVRTETANVRNDRCRDNRNRCDQRFKSSKREFKFGKKDRKKCSTGIDRRSLSPGNSISTNFLPVSSNFTERKSICTVGQIKFEKVSTEISINANDPETCSDHCSNSVERRVELFRGSTTIETGAASI